jgi:hypothetical protein
MTVFLFGFMPQLAFLSSTCPSIRSVTLVEPISSNAQNSVVVQLRHWTVTLLLDLNYQLWRLCIVEHGDGAAHLASHFQDCGSNVHAAWACIKKRKEPL